MNKIKFVSAAMAAVLTFSAGASFIPQNTSAITANAATQDIFAAKKAAIKITYYVNGDGVRLRKSPGNGTILGLMYQGETVKVKSISNGWAYVYRNKTKQYGYMSTQYLGVKISF